MAELQLIIVFHCRHFVRHLGICNRICIKLYISRALLLRTIRWKNEVTMLINGCFTSNYSVDGRHVVRHLEICNPMCVKLLQVMSGVIWRKIKTTSLSQTVLLVSTNTANTDTHTDTKTHTHTHDDSNRRNAMRCLSFKNNSSCI